MAKSQDGMSALVDRVIAEFKDEFNEYKASATKLANAFSGVSRDMPYVQPVRYEPAPDVSTDWQDEPTGPGATRIVTDADPREEALCRRIAERELDRRAVYYPIPGIPNAYSSLDLTGCHITIAGCHCGDAECTRCDPMERMVDGLTVRECLERYTQWQRRRDQHEGRTIAKHTNGFKYDARPFDLTTAQTVAAKSAWSSQLRARQAQERERERVEVVCERDEDGE